MRQYDLDRLAFGDLLERIAAGTYSPRGGARLIRSHPLTDLPAVQQQQRVHVEVDRTLDAEAHPPFESIPEVDPLLPRLVAVGARLDATELWDLRLVIGALHAMGRYLTREGRRAHPVFLEAYGAIGSYARELDILDRCLDPGGVLRDDASPELLRLRREITRQQERLRTAAHELAARLHREGTAQEPEPTLRDGRFVVAVPAEQRGRVPGVALDRSRSGQTFFIEPVELAEAGLELRQLQRDEAQEVDRLLRELTALCAARRRDIGTDLDRLAVLDAAQAAARYPGAGPLTLPEVAADDTLELIETRHPLLAAAHGADRVVPLSLTLSNGIRTLVISGPNAGGKTVALQTVGLCTALALCGLPIPAREGSRVPWVERMHVDIGDEQSLEADLSTFTARLKRLREMLAPPPGPKLCLIDEAGAGTDPAQGAALAIAILDELTASGALTVCITHDGRIKAHAAQAAGMGNGRMIFSDSALTPTYEFRAGEPGRSFAFEIAERSGLPAGIVARARDYLGPAEQNLDRVLRETELMREELTALTRRAERDARLAAADRARYEALSTELAASEQSERRRAAEEAGRIVAEARRRIEAEVREIRERQASARTIRRAHAVVGEVEAEIAATLEAAAVPEARIPEPLKEGDRVMLRNLQRPATVLSAGSDRIRVQAGSLTVEVDRAELEPLPETAAPVPRAVVRTPVKSVPEHLEIIGLRVEEARERVEKYLDDALLAGLGRVRIIHGSGTGALRRMVAEVLSGHPDVASYDVERDRPGGYGITRVVFKGGTA